VRVEGSGEWVGRDFKSGVQVSGREREELVWSLFYPIWFFGSVGNKKRGLPFYGGERGEGVVGGEGRGEERLCGGEGELGNGGVR
jgi:hypothetical protein